MKKDESDVQAIMQGITAWVPSIWSSAQALMNIYTGIPASADILGNYKTVVKRGQAARDEFFSRFNNVSIGNKKFFDPIRKQTSKTFGAKQKTTKITTVPEDQRHSFADILSKYKYYSLEVKKVRVHKMRPNLLFLR